MENKTIPEKINKKNICVAQMLYGGGGEILAGYRVYKDKPYTMQVGYTIDDEVFVNRFGQYAPIFKVVQPPEKVSIISPEWYAFLQEVKKIPKGIYASLEKNSSFDLTEFPEEIDKENINKVLEVLETTLYEEKDKLGTRELTEFITVPSQYFDEIGVINNNHNKIR